MSVAPVQRELLDFLKRSLGELEVVADEGDRKTLHQMRERLDGWAAKVAVIGQVKAGKSTFLNAFLAQPDFLPSDINPWTSVVTNIRINVPGDPETGAVFHFFDESDWNEMLNGTNTIREMAEELLPGFDADLLRQQSLALKEKAQRRVGVNKNTNQGSPPPNQVGTPHHKRPDVCAGPGSDEGLTRESLGRYSALTREANIFLRVPEFQVPTIVTDTPGVNDPFLVRDEVTCRSLDKSDVFLVVLSAHQALTDVDIGLIRLLAQQDGKDVVIFINRIDELEDYDVKYDRIIEDVSNRLSAAIPDITFNILAGSGFMAHALLSNDAESEGICSDLDDDILAQYLERRYGTVPSERADRLRLGSGVDAVRETLSRVIDLGFGCNQLSHFTYDLFAEVSAMMLSLKRERGTLLDDMQNLKDGQIDKIVASMQTQIAELEDAHAKAEALVTECDSYLADTRASSLAGVTRELDQAVSDFIVGHRDSFAERLSGDAAESETYEIDLTALHRQMEEILGRCYDAARTTIDASLDACMRSCETVVRDSLHDEIKNLGTDGLPHTTFSTTLATARKTLQANIVNERSWKFWRSKTVDQSRTLDAMCKLASEELTPILKKLSASFADAQEARSDAGRHRIGVVTRMLEGLLADGRRMLDESRATLTEAAEDAGARDAFIAQLQTKIDALEDRLQKLDALNLSMSEVPVLKAA